MDGLKSKHGYPTHKVGPEIVDDSMSAIFLIYKYYLMAA